MLDIKTTCMRVKGKTTRQRLSAFGQTSVILGMLFRGRDLLGYLVEGESKGICICFYQEQ